MWTHGENTQDSPNIDPGGRRWRRGNGDIRDVIPVGTEFGGVPGIQVSGEGKKSRETHGTLHLLALEVKGGNYKGGTKTTTMMQSLWDAHDS